MLNILDLIKGKKLTPLQYAVSKSAIAKIRSFTVEGMSNYKRDYAMYVDDGIADGLDMNMAIAISVGISKINSLTVHAYYPDITVKIKYAVINIVNEWSNMRYTLETAEEVWMKYLCYSMTGCSVRSSQMMDEHYVPVLIKELESNPMIEVKENLSTSDEMDASMLVMAIINQTRVGLITIMEGNIDAKCLNTLKELGVNVIISDVPKNYVSIKTTKGLIRVSGD